MFFYYLKYIFVNFNGFVFKRFSFVSREDDCKRWLWCLLVWMFLYSKLNFQNKWKWFKLMKLLFRVQFLALLWLKSKFGKTVQWILNRGIFSFNSRCFATFSGFSKCASMKIPLKKGFVIRKPLILRIKSEILPTFSGFSRWNFDWEMFFHSMALGAITIHVTLNTFWILNL